MSKLIKKTFSGLIDLIFPEKNSCLVCGYWDESIGEDYICKECLYKFKNIKGHNCKICSKPLITSGDICIECIETPKSFEKIYTPYKYEGLIRDVIKDYKYKNKPYYYKMLGELLYKYIKEIDIDFDIISYVPLHKNKKKKRGYNQSELMAKYLGKKLDIPCERLIERVVDTKPQNQLKREDRVKNLKNTFMAVKNLQSQNILIVDDVYTTGTTLNECSKSLLKVEVENIYGLTIAR